jgi:hypothetical protein
MEEIITAIFTSPLANLFVVAGLVFLGVAVIGDISGKIQPGKTGRIFSGLLGMVLMGMGLMMYGRQPPPGSGVPTNVPTVEVKVVTTEPSPPERQITLLTWTVDPAGVCRDDKGGYPRWSEYNGWTLSQCQEACQNNPNCQGVAMSKEKNYCQLFGSDGQYDGSNPGTQITRGDSSYSQYTCYIKP